jgi:hypothetical protein
MKTKELYFLRFLVISNSQNRMTNRHPFFNSLHILFCCLVGQSHKGGEAQGFFNLNNHQMKKNKNDWRQSVSIARLPKLLLFGIVFAASSLTYAQSNEIVNVPLARMTHDNSITIRTGLNETYKIPMGHFGFATTQEAEAYFQARSLDYITFNVIDVETVYMNFDFNHPAVANWTLSDWNQALANRAANVSPRAISGN